MEALSVGAHYSNFGLNWLALPQDPHADVRGLYLYFLASENSHIIPSDYKCNVGFL